MWIVLRRDCNTLERTLIPLMAYYCIISFIRGHWLWLVMEESAHHQFETYEKICAKLDESGAQIGSAVLDSGYIA